MKSGCLKDTGSRQKKEQPARIQGKEQQQVGF